MEKIYSGENNRSSTEEGEKGEDVSAQIGKEMN